MTERIIAKRSRRRKQTMTEIDIYSNVLLIFGGVFVGHGFAEHNWAAVLIGMML